MLVQDEEIRRLEETNASCRREAAALREELERQRDSVKALQQVPHRPRPRPSLRGKRLLGPPCFSHSQPVPPATRPHPPTGRLFSGSLVHTPSAWRWHRPRGRGARSLPGSFPHPVGSGSADLLERLTDPRETWTSCERVELRSSQVEGAGRGGRAVGPLGPLQARHRHVSPAQELPKPSLRGSCGGFTPQRSGVAAELKDPF